MSTSALLLSWLFSVMSLCSVSSEQALWGWGEGLDSGGGEKGIDEAISIFSNFPDIQYDDNFFLSLVMVNNISTCN